MKKFTAFITGRESRIVRGRIGQAYHEPVTVQAKDRNQARMAVEAVKLPGERVVYIGPGENGHEIPPARG